MRSQLWAVAAAALTAGLAGCDARLPDPDSPGARLYASRCGGCHRLYAPRLMTAPMWAVTLARMQGEFVRRGLYPLAPAERQRLLDYLEDHSADSKG